MLLLTTADATATTGSIAIAGGTAAATVTAYASANYC